MINSIPHEEFPFRVKQIRFIPKLRYQQHYKIKLSIPSIPSFAESVDHQIRRSSDIFNPSILLERTSKGSFYLVLLRCTKYLYRYTKLFGNYGFNKITINRTYLLFLDIKFRTVGQTDIIEDNIIPILSLTNRGMEDGRLFKTTSGQYWFTCTTLDSNKKGVPQISIVKLPENVIKKYGERVLDNINKKSSHESIIQFPSIRISLMAPLPSPVDPLTSLYSYKIKEKNWLPFEEDGMIRAIYNYDPPSLVEIEPKKGNCYFIIKERISFNFSRFRGSGGPIPFIVDSDKPIKGYLIIIHEAVDFVTKRNYYHRFVWCQIRKDKFEIKRFSHLFTFFDHSVEFCAGLCYHDNGTDIVISIGIDDQSAHLVTISIERVESMLIRIPPQVLK